MASTIVVIHLRSHYIVAQLLDQIRSIVFRKTVCPVGGWTQDSVSNL